MSYSIQFNAPTKAEAKARFAAEFDAVVAQQPVHAADRSAAIANLNAAVDLLSEDDTQQIRVNAHGSLSYLHNPEQITGACVSANAWLMPKETA